MNNTEYTEEKEKSVLSNNKEKVLSDVDSEENEESVEETSEEDTESEESSEEESIEEEEPELKYKRLEADVSELLKKDAASAMAVSDKYVALGTHNGDLFILDFDGNLIKRFSSHSATVNDISIDVAEEYVASASMDGKVVIHGMYIDSERVFNYRRPVKCVALDPDFSRKDSQQFVSGGLAGQLILNEKDKVLQHSGEGPIYTARWNGNLIAYANDEGVKMYDTQSQQRITYIKRPSGSPRPDLYRCNLCWRSNNQLLIGWANYVQIAIVKEQTVSGLPPLYAEISMFQTDFIVCGIAPFNEMTLLLAYLSDEITKNEMMDDPEQYKRPRAKRPEIRIINSLKEEISTDALPLHGFQHCQANDYILDYYPSEDMFYVVSPKDLVLAKPRDLDDHISWLLDRYRYEEALSTLKEAQAWGGSKVYDLTEVGEKYLGYLVDEGEFAKAAENCPKIIKDSKDSKKLWERWVFRFAELKHLQEITPYIPFQSPDPQLSSTAYEMVLAHFLNNDHQALCDTIMKWPPTIYNISSVTVLVEDIVEKDPDNKILMECLAELRPNVFDLIRNYNLFSAVQDKVVLLMDFDQYLISEKKNQLETEAENKEQDSSKKIEPVRKSKSKKDIEMPAVQLLVENVESIPIGHVVSQLRSHQQYLHTYLDALFNKDHHIGYEFHDDQVELYAEYDYPRLIEFLRSSNYYDFEKAYKICKQRDLVPEMVFVLGRMGNNKQALMLIIERLGDVQLAIDFVNEQDDDILWEDLLTYSLDKPRFITGLLENLGGTRLDPIILIKRIPNGLEIPELKKALIKVLHDYNLQASLREGCQKILVSDSVSMADQLIRAQKRGISCGEDMVCSICSSSIIKEANTSENIGKYVIFFCRHAYHEECLFDADTILPLPENINKSSSINGVGPKVRRTIILRSMTPSPQCPICNDSQHNHSNLNKKNPNGSTGPIRGFVRSQNRQSVKDDDGMPPMSNGSTKESPQKYSDTKKTVTITTLRKPKGFMKKFPVKAKDKTNQNNIFLSDDSSEKFISLESNTNDTNERNDVNNVNEVKNDFENPDHLIINQENDSNSLTFENKEPLEGQSLSNQYNNNNLNNITINKQVIDEEQMDDDDPTIYTFISEQSIFDEVYNSAAIALANFIKTIELIVLDASRSFRVAPIKIVFYSDGAEPKLYNGIKSLDPSKFTEFSENGYYMLETCSSHIVEHLQVVFPCSKVVLDSGEDSNNIVISKFMNSMEVLKHFKKRRIG
ncbi:3839_t:CDS:10 [Diversispora eburnea]|uniref:3839_t:CDS:1 n=1 Tax=Diversispora eburnea TaxID=1213867 RepID=A0A9N8UYG5_9GLOM|nr:3839_t:CDS:10 [Diversispora eburnea]